MVAIPLELLVLAVAGTTLAAISTSRAQRDGIARDIGKGWLSHSGTDEPCPECCEKLKSSIKYKRDKLVKRYEDMRRDDGEMFTSGPNGQPSTGTMSWQGHVDQYNGWRKGLRDDLNLWRSGACQGDVGDAAKWADTDAPTQPAPKVD